MQGRRVLDNRHRVDMQYNKTRENITELYETDLRETKLWWMGLRQKVISPGKESHPVCTKSCISSCNPLELESHGCFKRSDAPGRCSGSNTRICSSSLIKPGVSLSPVIDWTLRLRVSRVLVTYGVPADSIKRQDPFTGEFAPIEPVHSLGSGPRTVVSSRNAPSSLRECRPIRGREVTNS